MLFAAMAFLRLARGLVACVRIARDFSFPVFLALWAETVRGGGAACILGGLPAVLARCSMAFPNIALDVAGLQGRCDRSGPDGVARRSPRCRGLAPRQACAFDRPRSARQWFAGRLG